MHKTPPVLLVAAVLLQARSSAQPPLAPPPVARGSTGALTGVLVDRPGDGNVWCLAPGYKARFGTDGVDYIPYFGAKAPRNWPIAFRLRSVARGGDEIAWVRDVEPAVAQSQVSYDRGPVTEVWDLRTHEVEQTFVVSAPASAGRGDLVVTLDVETELAGADGPDGLRFAAASLGSVRYGEVVTSDGMGRETRTAPRWLAPCLRPGAQ